MQGCRDIAAKQHAHQLSEQLLWTSKVCVRWHEASRHDVVCIPLIRSMNAIVWQAKGKHGHVDVKYILE